MEEQNIDFNEIIESMGATTRTHQAGAFWQVRA